MAVVGCVAIDDAGGGALGHFTGPQDGDADAVEYGIAQRFLSGRFNKRVIAQIFLGQGFRRSGQGFERWAIVQRRLHAAGASIAEVERDSSQQCELTGGLDDAPSAA